MHLETEKNFSGAEIEIEWKRFQLVACSPKISVLTQSCPLSKKSYGPICRRNCSKFRSNGRMALPTTSSVVMDSLHYRKWGGYFKGTKIPDGMETVSGAVVKIMESFISLTPSVRLFLRHSSSSFGAALNGHRSTFSPWGHAQMTSVLRGGSQNLKQ